jgi:anti-anti-sigma factor
MSNLKIEAGGPKSHLKIEIEDREGAGGRLAQVVRLAGELDNTTWTAAAAALKPLLAAPFPHVVFNLSELSYLSSAGIAVLLDARKRLEAKKVTVTAVGMRPAIRKVFDIMNTMPASRIFGSVAELDEYLAAIQAKVSDQDG